jgi:RloB-like protein
MARTRFSFARSKATRLPIRRFIIYCEGTKTEPGYFDAVGKNLKSSLIEVKCEPTGVPKTIAHRAVERAKSEGLAKGSRRKPKNSFELNDQVWVVFDRDDHDCFQQSVNYCVQHGVGVARSNPCFEVWLILHAEDFNRSDDRHQVCQHLRKLRPEYDPGGSKTCDWTKLLEHVEEAEQRALRQLAARDEEGDPFGRHSTTVGQLTATIRKAAEESMPR